MSPENQDILKKKRQFLLHLFTNCKLDLAYTCFPCMASGTFGHYLDASRGWHLEENLDQHFAKLKVRHFV